MKMIKFELVDRLKKAWIPTFIFHQKSPPITNSYDDNISGEIVCTSYTKDVSSALIAQ